MAILTAAERIGTTLAGKYRLDRILGAGGMGTVFAGVHAWTGREVAVKMLNADYATDATVVQRFLQEARRRQSCTTRTSSTCSTWGRTKRAASTSSSSS